MTDFAPIGKMPDSGGDYVVWGGQAQTLFQPVRPFGSARVQPAVTAE